MVHNNPGQYSRHLKSVLNLFAVLLLAACSTTNSPRPTAPSQAPTKPAAIVQTATSIPRITAQPPEVKNTQAAPTSGTLKPTGTIIPTPDCSKPASLTPAMTEGPYYKTGSPERASLIEPGMKGTRLSLSGYVLTSDCQPVTHAMLDFWQANAQGKYDNNGYTLRGHEYTDENGYYHLDTIVPGIYPARTEHIHVKVQAPGGPLLTTQLFFPGVAQNKTDSIYSDQLLLSVRKTPNGLLTVFNFVVQTQQ
ncbi:MAG: hypothetical protein P8Z00_06295 [Anaerolineales bacterium]|jgi:protocatechuate 3,4-dioxygenase beta subunit